MSNAVKKYIPIFLLAITSPIWIPIILLLNFFSTPANRKPEEVLEVLEAMKTGEIDNHWFDDFLSVPIKDSALEKIRQECEGIYTEKSPYLLRKENDIFSLNESGVEAIEGLIKKCKAIKSA